MPDSNEHSVECASPCEGEVLIIEVLGKDHPEGHAFRIFDKADTAPRETLEGQVDIQKLEDTVIHAWPWRGQPERNVWLEIDAESGDPIRVPFLRDAGAVEREMDRQRHVILPVIPTTLVSGVRRKGANACHHVMSRPGFVYLFHEGKLWRELEIRINDQGVTHYHDVPLQQYRKAGGEFEPGYRTATGKGLREIWVPARMDRKWLGLEAAYSESQWPGPRINYLEKHPFARVERCSTIRMEPGEPRHKDGESQHVYIGNTNAFPASVLAPQRSRNPAIEWQFDRPEKYLLDLKGDYPQSALQAAMAIHQRQEDPDPEDPIYEDERPEMTALANCLHNTLKEVEAAANEGSENSNGNKQPFEWTAKPPAAEDCARDARDRFIGAIQLDDHVGRLRYLQERRQVAAWFANAAVRRARVRPYFDSALLMNAVVVPSRMGGKPNPLHKYMSEINGQGRKELERSIAVSERKLAVEYGTCLQKDLRRVLQGVRPQHALADLFTHSGYDYAGAFHFLTSLIQEVVREPGECDVLAARVEGAVDGEGKEWLRDLCSAGHGNLLYTLLFPRFRSGDLEKDFEPSAEPGENTGDGHFRGSELAALANADLPEPEQVKTRDGLELAAAAEQGAFATAFAVNLRTGTQALLSVHGNLWGAIHHASQTLVSNDSQLKEVEQQLAELEAEKVQLDRDRADAERAYMEEREKLANENRSVEHLKREARARAERFSAQETGLARKKMNLAAREQQLKSKAVHAQMKLYSGSLQQLRASMPALMGRVRLERLSKALQNDYHVIGLTGLEELPEGERAVRMFGDITRHGDDAVMAQASTNKSRARAQGLPSDRADDFLVLVVPRNEQFAKVLEKLKEAEQQYNKALADLETLKRTHIGELPAASAALLARRITSAEAELENARGRLNKINRNLRAVNDAAAGLEAEKANLETEHPALRKTMDDIESRRLYRVLHTPILPAAVMLMELHNVSGVNAAYDRDERAKGWVNARAGAGSARIDLVYATTMLAERFLQHYAIVERISTQFLSRELTGKFGQILAKLVGGPVTPGKLFGGIAGFAMAVDSTLDAHYAYRMGNTGTAVGSGILAIGGLALGFANLAGKAGLLFLGPAGWLALGVVLAISGTVVAAWFSEEPMEIWMRHGPFGPMAEKPFLKEPDEAYYRLVSLLMGVSISVEPNPLRGKALLGELDEDNQERLAALEQANTRLRIESAIPGLFKGAAQVIVDPHLQLAETKYKRGYLLGVDDMNKSTETAIDGKEELREYVLWEEEVDAGTHVYLKTPLTRSTERERWFGAVTLVETWAYHWNVRIQLRVRTGEDAEPMVFPAPDPEDPLVYDKDDKEHTQPDFQEKDRPFWYNEKVYYHG